MTDSLPFVKAGVMAVAEIPPPEETLYIVAACRFGSDAQELHWHLMIPSTAIYTTREAAEDAARGLSRAWAHSHVVEIRLPARPAVNKETTDA
jgi:hypothetical protein